MADNLKKSHEYENEVGHEEGSVETKDRGLFDFIGKKKEEKKPQQQEVITTDYDQKVKISDAEENKSGLLEKLVQGKDHISSSSPNDYKKEGVEGNKEKKGVTEQIKEKISGDDKKEEKDTSNVAIDRFDETKSFHPEKLRRDNKQPQDEKGLFEKVKEKLPAGQHKRSEEEHHVTNAPPPVVTQSTVIHHEESEDANEKKGLLDKIKEKLPGYHSKTEDENEKVKEAGH